MNIINKINTCRNFTVGRIGYSIQGICDHITMGNAASALSWFQNPSAQASCHFLVCKNGDIIQLVSENNQSWCQGIVKSPTAKIYFDNNSVNPNKYLIGIEHEGTDGTLTQLQYQATVDLHKYLIKKYNIKVDRDHIIGHYQLDPITRAYCPGTNFPWINLMNELYFFKAISKLSNSPDYWNINCVVGKNINGEYLKQLILNFCAMFKTVPDFQSAINYLVSIKVVSSPTYWITNCVSGKTCQGDYCRILIQNMGTKF